MCSGIVSYTVVCCHIQISGISADLRLVSDLVSAGSVAMCAAEYEINWRNMKVCLFGISARQKLVVLIFYCIQTMLVCLQSIRHYHNHTFAFMCSPGLCLQTILHTNDAMTGGGIEFRTWRREMGTEEEWYGMMDDSEYILLIQALFNAIIANKLVINTPSPTDFATNTWQLAHLYITYSL